MSAKVMVFGPAYLDRVLRVDRPLIDRDLGPPLDQSVEGACGFGDGARISSSSSRPGPVLEIDLPAGWPGPFGQGDARERASTPAAKARRPDSGS